MALIGPKGEYLRIINISLQDGYVNNVSYDIFANEAQRTAGLTEFEVKRSGSVNSGALQTELDKMGDVTRSIVDNFKVASYNAIKNDTFDFSNWTDG